MSASVVCRHLAPREICPQCIRAAVARIDDPACEDCNDTGTITDPAPDAPRARPPEPCVSCPPRTLPVTPAERLCATMLRAWKEWSSSENTGTPIAEATSIDVTRSLRNRGWIDAFDLTPAGRELLARVEAEERTPATVLRATLSRLRDAINNPPDGDDNDWKSAMRAALREHEAALAGTVPLDAPPRREP